MKEYMLVRIESAKSGDKDITKDYDHYRVFDSDPRRPYFGGYNIDSVVEDILRYDRKSFLPRRDIIATCNPPGFAWVNDLSGKPIFEFCVPASANELGNFALLLYKAFMGDKKIEDNKKNWLRRRHGE